MFHRYLRAMGAVLLALIAAGADAADLTINFNGKFESGTCSFTAPDADLGTYQATSFTGSTITAWRQVRIRRSGCTSDITVVHMKFNGTADATNNTYFAVRNVSGNVTGVAIELGNLDPRRITPNTTVLDWNGNNATYYDVQARFVQTRPTVTAGSINTPITIQFTYN